MNYMQKLGYLKGLADGLNPDLSNSEGKLIAALIDVVEEMASALGELEESVASVEEQLDDLYEEFDDLADELEGFQDIGLDSGEKDNIRMFRHEGGGEDDEEDDDDDGEEPVIYQLVCPACQGEILIDEDELDSDIITCPSCKAQLELDSGCGCCGCGHDHGNNCGEADGDEKDD